MSRFVRPETLTLPLSQGDSITVKKRLNSGEERDLFARMYVAGVDGQLKANPFQTGIALVTSYLLDWTFKDDGKLVPIAGLAVDALITVLNNLEPEAYGEIRRAIEAHDGASRTEREQEKNAKDGGMALPATSPSPSAVAGVMSGSVN